jgi:hypothetical protein
VFADPASRVTRPGKQADRRTVGVIRSVALRYSVSPLLAVSSAFSCPPYTAAATPKRNSP